MIHSRLELLSEEDIARLNDAIFYVLQNVGMWINHDGLLKALRDFGAEVDMKHQMIKLPPPW